MADNTTPVTAGTTLEKHFGAGAYGQTYGGNITQQMIANLVNSGALSREETRAVTGWQTNMLGYTGMSQLYPEQYTFARPRPLSREEAQLSALYKLQGQFGGISGTWIRWLLGNEISRLSQKIKQLYGCSYVPLSSTKPKAAPTPEWMKPYIETGMPYVQPSMATAEQLERQATTRRRISNTPATPAGQGQLRPIGAQEELSAEQMEAMAAYGAWGKAGFPTSFQNRSRDQIIGAMADQERFWQPFVALSQKLFPSRQNLGRQWATAQQR